MCDFLCLVLNSYREDGPHRLLFIEKLVEDRTDYGTSYYELLTHIGRQIKWDMWNIIVLGKDGENCCYYYCDII